MLTVLIAEPEQLEVLKAWPDFAEAQTFTDAELPAALGVVTTERPDIVAIEQAFAKKPRGAALINRIKADASLDSCTIRIVSLARCVSKSPGRGSAAATVRPATTRGSAASTAVAAAAPRAARDQNNRRRAQRFKIIEGIEVVIDGTPAMLVDLSMVGAQVVSNSLLKPNQRVRVSILEGTKPVRFTADVVWSTFELPKVGARYRAGIEFFDADPDTVSRLCDTNRTGRSN